MKRFFCTTCNKIRRSRFIPASVSDPHAEKPQDRIGLCAAHMMGLSLSQHVAAERPTPKSRPVFTKPVSVKSGKKGK